MALMTKGILDVGDLLTRIRRSFSSQSGLALRCGSNELDWSDALSRIAAIEDGLSRAGIDPGATVAVMGRNDIASGLALVGVLVSGRCAAIVNPFSLAPAVLEAARAYMPDVILLAEDDPMIEATSWEDSTLVMMADGQLISKGRQRSSLLGSGAGHKRTGIVISTSGTTGVPKPFHLPVEVLSRAMREIEAIHAGFGDRRMPDESWPALIQYSPLSHIGGALTVLRAMAQGRATVMLGKFDAELWAETVERCRPFTTGLPPSMMRMVVRAKIDASRLKSLVSVWSGTAPLRSEDRQAFADHYGLPVLGNYGATEFCGAIAAWSLEGHHKYFASRPNAVGRIDPAVAQARVRNTDGELIQQQDAVGVLEFKVGRIGDRWIKTSDLGMVDAKGFLTLQGRADDSIIRGGFKLSPKAIADTLRQHPEVRDAAVVGIADERLGHVPVAVVELTENASVSDADLKEYVRARLPAYFVPTQVRSLEHLPRNAAMKLDRRAIGALFEG